MGIENMFADKPEGETQLNPPGTTGEVLKPRGDKLIDNDEITQFVVDAVADVEGTQYTFRMPDEKDTSKTGFEAKPEASEDFDFAAHGLQKPDDWDSKTGEERYKHVQSAFTRASQEKKDFEKKYTEAVDLLQQYDQYVKQVQPYLPYVNALIQGQLSGRPLAPIQPEEPIDPVTIMSDPKEFDNYFNKKFASVAGTLRQLVIDAMNSDPRMQLLSEGIDLQRSMGSAEDSELKPLAEAIRQEQPELSWAAAFKAARTAARVRPKPSSVEAGNAQDANTSQRPGTKILNRDEVRARADSLAGNTRVSPTGIETILPPSGLSGSRFDREMNKTINEVLYDHARQGRR